MEAGEQQVKQAAAQQYGCAAASKQAGRAVQSSGLNNRYGNGASERLDEVNHVSDNVMQTRPNYGRQQLH